MCVKVLNVPGKGDIRDCYANPHNSLDHMVGTCFTNNFQGYLTPICYCDTPFCNTGSTTHISTKSTLLILISSLYHYIVLMYHYCGALVSQHCLTISSSFQLQYNPSLTTVPPCLQYYITVV